MPQRYPDTNQQSYTSVIDEKSYRRLRATLDDARAKGAEVISLVPDMTFNDQLRKIPPHMVLGVTDDMLGMFERVPKFVKRYGSLSGAVTDAVKDYAGEVRSRSFPTADQIYAG